MFPLGFSIGRAPIQQLAAAAALSLAFLSVACSGNGVSRGLVGSASDIAINPRQNIQPQLGAALTVSPALFDHVTIVMMENHDYGQIIGSPQAPYINSLASVSALFTNSHALSHPSEPNYLALYSGSTQGVASDACPLRFSGPSLGGELIRASKSIRGYMEGLPSVGWSGCSYANYRRKHNPLIDFSDTPANTSVPYTQIVYDLLSNKYPDVAFVVPNLMHDMHDGTIAMGDAWLAANLPRVISYDTLHNGLLILTWDESDHSGSNWIATIFVGPKVQPGRYGEYSNHYSVLRTITDAFHLQPLNATEGIDGVWR